MSQRITAEKLKSQLNKKYGLGVVKFANEYPPVEFIESGIPLLDYTLTGGIPRGRITELWGPPKGGKTSTAAIYVAKEQEYQAQQDNPREIFYFDLENTYNIEWTNKLGVDNSRLNLIRHGGLDRSGNPVYLTAEDVINMTWDMAESGAVSLIVWDSLPSMTPRDVIESHDAGKRNVGGISSLMSTYLPEIVRVLNRNNCALIIINQYREKIGVMYGNPATRPGGHALEHYASLIVQVRMGDFYEEKIKDSETGADLGKHRIGNDCRIRVERNKVGPPFRDCTYAFYYDRGLDLQQAICDLALQLGVIQQRGAYYYHPYFSEITHSDYINVEKGNVQGRINLVHAIRHHDDLYSVLLEQCTERLNNR